MKIMNYKACITLLAIFLACQTSKSDKYQVQESDLEVIHQISQIYKQASGGLTTNYNSTVGQKCSKLYHIEGAARLDTPYFSPRMKENVISTIRKGHDGTKKISSENFKSLNNIEFNDNGNIFLSDLIYGNFKEYNYCSVFLYIVSTKNELLGIYFYFEEDDNGYYQLQYYDQEVPINQVNCNRE